ncbi:MAG: hypothetical protein K6G88_03880, partial [Lachnospiraceae bacterium]|nr:hypothetical protein [Lachnospiraceae bacterium]
LNKSVNAPKIKAIKHKRKAKQKKNSENKVNKRFTDDNTSITDIELERNTEDEKKEKIEKKRKEQTKAYNYTDKD